MTNKGILAGAFTLALGVALSGCNYEDNGQTYGEIGAGSTKAGRPGGGTPSTPDLAMKAYNLDPTSGVTVASRGTTGSAEIYTTPQH